MNNETILINRRKRFGLVARETVSVKDQKNTNKGGTGGKEATLPALC
jgi:hypothetical protein